MILESILYEELAKNKVPKNYMKGLGGMPLFQYCVIIKLLSNKKDQADFNHVFSSRNLAHFGKYSQQKNNAEKVIIGLKAFKKIYNKYIMRELFQKM